MFSGGLCRRPILSVCVSFKWKRWKSCGNFDVIKVADELQRQTGGPRPPQGRFVLVSFQKRQVATLAGS